MASRGHIVTTLGIVELGDMCREMQRRNAALFELLGRCVADEPDPKAQRLFAEAGQRHAWHADLWGERTPTIPGEHGGIASRTTAPTHDRVEWYRAVVAELRADLDRMRSRVDPELDASTLRTVTLVDADLADLEHRVSAD